MKTFIILFGLFFVGTTLSAQIVKRQVKVSRVPVQSKMIDHKEPTISGKKGLVKKIMVVDRKKLVIQRKK